MPLEIKISKNVSNRACIGIAQSGEAVLFEVNLFVELSRFGHVRGISCRTEKFHGCKARTVFPNALPPAAFVESLGICDTLMFLGVCKSCFCGFQVFFAIFFIWVHTGHNRKHCGSHARRVGVICITFDFARFAAVTRSEFGHCTGGYPFVVVLVAVAFHGHEVVLVNGGFDPEVRFVAEFFEEVAHIVWLAAFAGVVLAGFVVRVVARIKVVESLGEFGEAES